MAGPERQVGPEAQRQAQQREAQVLGSAPAGAQDWDRAPGVSGLVVPGAVAPAQIGVVPVSTAQASAPRISRARAFGVRAWAARVFGARAWAAVTEVARPV